MTATMVPTEAGLEAMPIGGAVVDGNAALATLRTGIAACAPGGTLLFANPRFGGLFGLAQDHLTAGIPFARMLDLMAAREEFAELARTGFISARRIARGARRHAGCAPAARWSTSPPIRCPMAAGR